MIKLIKFILYPIAEILLCVALPLIFLFLCVAFLGEFYGILAVFLSVGLWAFFASIIGGK